jgi:hypothetical protein
MVVVLRVFVVIIEKEDAFLLQCIVTKKENVRIKCLDSMFCEGPGLNAAVACPYIRPKILCGTCLFFVLPLPACDCSQSESESELLYD